MPEEEKETYLNKRNLTYVKGKNKDLENCKLFNININNNKFNYLS